MGLMGFEARGSQKPQAYLMYVEEIWRRSNEERRKP